MPYDIEERDGEFCVIKRDDGTSEGCHEMREMAEEQMAALYAAEEKAKDDKALSNIVGYFKSMVNRLLPLQAKEIDLAGGVFKAMGNSLWMAAFTNNFQDREKEILLKEGHKRYVGRVQKGYIDMPELRFWHVPGSQHGKALWVDMVEVEGGPVVLMAIGEFDDTPVGKAAEKHYLEAGPLAYKLSHGFFYPAWARKDYGDYVGYSDFNTFEITTLPAEKRAEANEFTAWQVEKGELIMNLPDETRKEIETRFGADMLKQIDAMSQSVEERAKSIADAGVKFKDFVDTEPPKTEGAADKSAAPVADTQLITELMAAFSENDKAVSDLTNLVTGALTKFEEASTNFNTAANELREFLSQTPQGVDSGIENAVEGEGAEEAAKNIKARSEPDTTDKFWGFPVPNKTGGA